MTRPAPTVEVVKIVMHDGSDPYSRANQVRLVCALLGVPTPAHPAGEKAGAA